MKNVFEVLGLAADHRGTDKIAQLPRHMDEIAVAKSKEGPFFVDDKYDGNHAVIPVKNGKILGVFSRVGKPFQNLEPLLKLIKSKKMPDGVYYAELYVKPEVMPMQKFQALHGTNRKAALSVPQQEVMDNESRLAFFDRISIKEFIGDEAGVAKCDTPLEVRREKLEGDLKKFSKSARVHHVKYEMADDEEAVCEIAKNRIASGQEGIVAKGVRHPYVCGHKNFHFIKIVKKITFDLLCTGYTEGTNGKRKGTLESLSFEYGKDGEHTVTADLGKGYDDKSRLAMLKACLKGKKGKTPVGQIFEVYALEKIGLKNLRQPKVGKLREDKDTPDESITLDSKPETKKDKKPKKDKKVKGEKKSKSDKPKKEKKAKKDKKAKKK